ncbi:MAG: HypC/HybG/HupF family hydrogenase formation chaperone [Chrysiogenales bacterium]|nr:MAG: HypC/HybG/HupF family hydrogenase formation chaperone [Chrysiogenales bacterium]
MCLAVPMTVTRIEGKKAVAESRGVETAIDLSLSPDVRVGDRVIVHAGFVIEKLDEEAAQEIDRAWDIYRIAMEKEGPA